MRQNAEDDTPYFCVSVPILGRLMHTFKDNYLPRGTAIAVEFELTQHVDEIVEKNQGKHAGGCVSNSVAYESPH